MEQYLVGIDIGTSGTKSVLFALDGTIVAEAAAEYPMTQPQNGWAEQDPADWWQAVCTTLRAIAPKAVNGKIVGLGLSGQMHSTVLLDGDDNVIRPAILWCDQRTGAECREIEAAVGRDRLIEITANPALTGFSAAKIMWIKKHEPVHFARCAHILLAKDYIRFKLTGVYATEVSDASGMQLLDVPKRAWSAEICERLGIDMALLPRVYESAEVTGHVTSEAAVLTGLPAGLPVAGGAGDNAAAAIGTGVCRAGKAFTTIGTSGVVFAPTARPVIDFKGRIHTFCAAVQGQWHVMGVTQAAGLSLNWFRKNCAGALSYREIDALCERVPLGAEKLLYLPYLMGERTPILDADARGVFFGLSAMHQTAHMARAVIEGVSYSLYSCLDILRENKIAVDDMALCGGGGKSAFWQQLLCDIYGLPIKTVQSSEGAALGAAVLGGCAAGVYPSVEAGCAATVRENAAFYPDAERHKAYLAYYEIYKDLYPALQSSFAALGKL
jgi:xylulokinase